MTPQEFCHWLQGFFDGLNSPEALNEVQTHLMKEKLKMVFVEETQEENQVLSNTRDSIKCHPTFGRRLTSEDSNQWNKTVEQVKRPLPTDEETSTGLINLTQNKNDTERKSCNQPGSVLFWRMDTKLYSFRTFTRF